MTFMRSGVSHREARRSSELRTIVATRQNAALGGIHGEGRRRSAGFRETGSRLSTGGEIVAIKVLNSQLARNPLVVRRFAKEARLLARIENAWIANILDFNSDQGFHFLAIEFVYGGALTDVIKAGRQIPERQALRLILDVSRGLAAAHQQEVFHRDVKPDNILLTAAGVDFMRMVPGTDYDPSETILPLAKLADFGLARTDRLRHQRDIADGRNL